MNFLYHMSEFSKGIFANRVLPCIMAPKRLLIKIIASVISRRGWYLRYLPQKLQGNRDIVLAAVKHNGQAIFYASDALRRDTEVVKAAIVSDPCAFPLSLLTDNMEIATMAVKARPHLISNISNRLHRDKNFALEVVGQYGSILRYMSPTLYDDEDVVLAACKGNGASLSLASERLRDNKDVVIAAVSSLGISLRYASERLRNDKDVVIAAVSNSGSALEFVPPGLRSDKDVVLSAVASDHDYLDVLEFVPEEFLDMEEVIMLSLSTFHKAMGSVGRSRQGIFHVMEAEALIMSYASERIQDMLENNFEESDDIDGYVTVLERMQQLKIMSKAKSGASMRRF